MVSAARVAHVALLSNSARVSGGSADDLAIAVRRPISAGTPTPTPGASGLLLEDNFTLLLEDSGKILLEA